ncbi:hypothetical protein RYH80_12825 [Halobaculum sp. MBLA0147]|uniref:hypothetical protein n=1 Tax=Halobaculum sp. MBLA0147 TaxID=3079934 RepID=UPI003524C89C
MGDGLSLKVPADEETAETGRRFYQYHADQSQYHESIDDILDYKYFRERLDDRGRFMIYRKIPHTIIEPAPDILSDLLDEHTENGHRFTDREGMEALSAWLEDARSTLAANGELSNPRDQTITTCQHMIEFALEHDYDIVYSY